MNLETQRLGSQLAEDEPRHSDGGLNLETQRPRLEPSRSEGGLKVVR